MERGNAEHAGGKPEWSNAKRRMVRSPVNENARRRRSPPLFGLPIPVAVVAATRESIAGDGRVGLCVGVVGNCSQIGR